MGADWLIHDAPVDAEARVATVRGESTAGRVIGHVICTVGLLDIGRAVGLGPIGVAPEQQASGVEPILSSL